MGFRFRRSIKLAPGIRWNISTSGSSFTLGPRGASVNVGNTRSKSRGTRSSNPRATPSANTTTLQITCSLSEDGILTFLDSQGNPLSERLIEVAKKQNRAAILELIQHKCDEINEQIEALGRLHHGTPDCRRPPQHVVKAFEEPSPSLPVPRKVDLLGRIFKKRREKIEDGNRQARAEHERALEAWHQRRQDHEQNQARRKHLVEEDILSDTGAMEQFLEERLQEIAWPRETTVSFEINPEGTAVMLDVDLPEIEHMPTRLAAVPARGLKLSVKELSPTQVHKLYMEHVHGILFRLVGETFAALPTVQSVVASGFSQRSNPATGKMQDDYLLSVRIHRARWAEIDFNRLDAIAVVEALGRHDIVRKMLRSGALQSISPLSASA